MCLYFAVVNCGLAFGGKGNIARQHLSRLLPPSRMVINFCLFCFLIVLGFFPPSNSLTHSRNQPSSALYFQRQIPLVARHKIVFRQGACLSFPLLSVRLDRFWKGLSVAGSWWLAACEALIECECLEQRLFKSVWDGLNGS